MGAIQSVFSKFRRPIEAPASTSFAEVESIIAAIDLAPFTVSGASATLAPEALIASLNKYLSAVLAVIEQSGGKSLRHVGDAVIAAWPVASDDAGRIRLGECLVQLIETIRTQLLPTGLNLRPQIGVAHGRVIMADLNIRGHQVNLELGRAVNFANRLNSLCGGHKTDILFLSDLPVIWPSRVEATFVEQITIAGDSQPHRLHALSFRSP